MMITKEEKAQLVTKFGGKEGNTGLPEVQVAILTARISNLTTHFADHKLDHHSKRGLMKLIGKRRRLLKYINGKDENRYKTLIKELGLRK
ncbi:MAG: 30S ribosomal protein S15 [Bacteriovoracaceae bacterium]|nr:30S ribosomal protein S15 [Bacteriovoracaceae bacterium]